MEIAGLLKDVPVEALIKQAEAEEQTGKLLLKSEAGIGEIRFENGLIYFADSPFVRERLGHRLVAEGDIHPSDLYRILCNQEEHPNHLLGEILLKKNLLPEGRVRSVIEKQTEEAVLQLLVWEAGQFSFERSAPQNSHEVFIKPHLLLKEKKQRIGELKAVRGKGLMERIQDHPDPLIHQKLHRRIEETLARTKTFEPRIVVLLVEGDAKWRMMVQDELAGQNFHVKGVSSTEKAQTEVEHMIGKGYSPIVVTDIDFPRQQNKMKLDGLSFMEDVHKKYPAMPILVSTAYPISNLRRKILFFGGTFCLVKPDLSILSSRNFEQIFQAFIRELIYCLDFSIQQYYQDYFQERAEIAKNDLIEDLYNTLAEQIDLGEQVIQDAKVQEMFYKVSDLLVREGNLDRAITTVLDFAIARYDHAALFLWGKKYLNGYLGKSSQRADFSDRIKSVSVEYGKIPLLKKVRAEKEILAGPVPSQAPYEKFLDAFLEARPRWHILYPVVVMGKVVALWYADTKRETELEPNTHVFLSLVNLISLSLKMDIENT